MAMLSGHASGGAVIGVTVAFTVMASIATGLRLWARIGVSRIAGWDDVLIFFGMVCSVATTIAMIFQVENGMGQHSANVNQAEGIALLKAFYASILVYNSSLTCTKLSILLQYLRIFPHRAFRIACFILMGVICSWSLYTFFTNIFACTPIAYFWDSSLDGKCLNRFAIWFSNSGISIVTDIVTGVLPLPMLKQLELPTRQRRALMIVFGLGGFTCIVSILRFQGLYAISQSTDVSWDNPLAAIWSSVEINTAIICSCLPTLRCLFPRLLKSQPSLSGNEYNHSRSTPKLFPSSNNQIVSSASGRYPLDEEGMSEEEFKKWKNHARQKSGHCPRRHKNVVDEIELDDPSAKPFPSGIHVTTAIEQEVERKFYDDSSSTRKLVVQKEFGEV